MKVLKLFYLFIILSQLSYADSRMPAGPILEDFFKAQTILTVKVVNQTDTHSKLKVLDIIKGDKRLLNTTFEMKKHPYSESHTNFTGVSDQQFIVFMLKNWQFSEGKIYKQEKADNESVKRAIKLYQMPERQRLQELQKQIFSKRKILKFETDPFNELIIAFQLDKSEKKILEAIKNDPTITIKSISEITGIVLVQRKLDNWIFPFS